MIAKKRLTRVAPVKAGKVLGILYGMLGLIFSPFFLVGALAGDEGVVGAIVFAVLFPIVYALGGLLGGIVVAALYNQAVKWTGGLEFEITDDSPIDSP